MWGNYGSGQVEGAVSWSAAGPHWFEAFTTLASEPWIGFRGELNRGMLEKVRRARSAAESRSWLACSQGRASALPNLRRKLIPSLSHVTTPLYHSNLRDLDHEGPACQILTGNAPR